MKKAFSLIELLVVISITAVLLAVSLPNFLSARERARDAKRKEEMQQIKNALRMYYSDFQRYPASGTCTKPTGGSYVNYIKGCTTTHVACCPCDSVNGIGFAIGETCGTVYMKKLPDDLGSSTRYFVNSAAAAPDDFCLRTTLENAADPDLASSQTRCGSSCVTAGTTCALGSSYYCICAD